jgi:hypothetical protein
MKQWSLDKARVALPELVASSRSTWRQAAKAPPTLLPDRARSMRVDPAHGSE